MASEPSNSVDWPNLPDNQADFYQDLKNFQLQRGTYDEKPARVQNEPINLWELFKNVRARGGYDKVTATKLLWREVALDFGLPNNNVAAYAYQLKALFYRQLAAYEIKRVYKQEPPPKIILEDQTAKGGDLLNRTLDNFSGYVANAQQDDQTDDDGLENGTHKGDRMDVDDPTSIGRSGRGLRQAPQQRQIFQPDITPSRQGRLNSGHAQSPGLLGTSQSYHQNSNPTVNPNSSSFNIHNYEPRRDTFIPLRELPTPATRPDFEELANKRRQQERERQGLAQPQPGIMLPGTGHPGPNIYLRTLLAARSSILSETDWALPHLVKISYERGDKYKFESFPGLSDALVDIILHVTSFIWDVKWEINYDDFQEDLRIGLLNGHDGTMDILDQLQELEESRTKEIPVDVIPSDVAHTISKSNEAALVMRNLLTMDENAYHLSQEAVIKDMLTIILNLPSREYFVELKHTAVEICEMLTKFWIMSSADPLYTTLIDVLEDTEDRAMSMNVMKSITLRSLNFEISKPPNPDNQKSSNREDRVPLEHVSVEIINKVFEWIMLNDEELVNACLDFIYQFMDVPDNVRRLLAAAESGAIDLQARISSLCQLWDYNKSVSVDEMHGPEAVQPPAKLPANTEIHELPNELMAQVLRLEEPARSAAWIKSLFFEDKTESITQIKLWQAYQSAFTPHASEERPLLPASDFIKNVSNTLAQANARVLDKETSQPRFIIDGIQARRIPTDLQGKPYLKCLWNSGTDACRNYFCSDSNMWEHVLQTHLGFSKVGGTTWDLEAARKSAEQRAEPMYCFWSVCRHFHPSGTKDALAVARHFATHLPDTSPGAEHRAKHNRTMPIHKADRVFVPEETQTVQFEDSPCGQRDQRDPLREATGLSASSVHVMRALARNIPLALELPEHKTPKLRRASGEDGWMEVVFGPVRKEIFQMAATNRTLAGYLLDLMMVIDKNMEKE